MDKPLILLSTGVRVGSTGLPYLHLYQNYADSVTAGGGLPLPVSTGEPEDLARLADLAQGLLLTGGVDIAPARYGQEDRGRCGQPDLWRDSVEWDLCGLFVQRGKPIWGICRGLQLLNVFFGGTLVQDLESERGLSHPDHSVHPLEAAPGSWLERTFGPSFPVNSYHHQAVDELGRGLVPTAFSMSGQVVEGLAHESLPILAVQWHPERMWGPGRRDPEGPDMLPFFTSFCSLCGEA